MGAVEALAGQADPGAMAAKMGNSIDREQAPAADLSARARGDGQARRCGEKARAQSAEREPMSKDFWNSSTGRFGIAINDGAPSH
jgi:hypothetical protein